MQLLTEGKCRPVNRTEMCQEEMWGGLSLDMYNVFRKVMHVFHLVDCVDSGKACVVEFPSVGSNMPQNCRLRSLNP